MTTPNISAQCAAITAIFSKLLTPAIRDYSADRSWLDNAATRTILDWEHGMPVPAWGVPHDPLAYDPTSIHTQIYSVQVGQTPAARALVDAVLASYIAYYGTVVAQKLDLTTYCGPVLHTMSTLFTFAANNPV